MDPIGDGDGGDREEVKNQLLYLRQYHDDDGGGDGAGVDGDGGKV